ncbi:MAG: hypothetical protein NC037_06550 [Bacteroides sp.]|nr:hypothetical protein [Bacillota bacterium]MCM1393522.1 hypothetical protein [[Eubacterium] siraeum]MCM1456164.1 hypothetical protein [Bacteroides sp.]
MKERALLRGKKLDKDCYKAKPIRCDGKCYCEGLHNVQYDQRYDPDCLECGALWINSEQTEPVNRAESEV